MVNNVRERLMKVNDTFLLHHCLDLTMKQRLQAEVIAWHKLCHRNISQLFGIVQFHSSIGMVSPWCENGTICQYLKGNITADRLDLVHSSILSTTCDLKKLHS